MSIDNRLFKRYKNKAPLSINSSDATYKAVTFDYSFGGLSAFVEGSPPIKEGDIVTLDVTKPGIKCDGKVVWVSRAPGGLKVGLQRTGLYYGSLNDFRLHDLLLGFQRSGKSGELHVIEGVVHKSIRIHSGDMVFASSNQPSERLGNALIEKGIISDEQHQKALDLMNKSRKRLGWALVELGYLKPNDINREVVKHVENIILGLFNLKNADFLFKEGATAEQEQIRLKLSAANLIFRGIKGITDVDYLKELCPPMESPLGLSSDPLDLFQGISLQEHEKSMLSHVDGKMTIRDILDASNTDKTDALKSICALYCTRMIDISGEEAASPALPVEDIVQEQARESEEFKKTVRYIYENREKLGSYGLLGIGQSAGQSDIKRAYYQKAKEFHPDKHYQLPEDMKEMLNAIFTDITTAYTKLISTHKAPEFNIREEPRPTGVQTGPKGAEHKYNLGKEAYWKGMYEDAMRYFSEAAYLDAKSARYHYYAGLAMAKLGKYKDAEKAMRRALIMEPFNPDMLADIGHVYISLGLLLRAKGSFEKALKISPGHKRAMEGMARTK